MKRSLVALCCLVLTWMLATAMVQAQGAVAERTAAAPYPPSRVIKGIAWESKDTSIRKAPGSDNWPITWADDDHQYSSWGDGGGFGGTDGDGRVSLGFARIEGSDKDYRGFNVWGGKNPEHPAQFPGKCYGIICIDGVLYAWVGHNHVAAQLVRSTDHAATWTKAPWKFTYADGMIWPTILNFGRNYAGARDNFVYHYLIKRQRNNPARKINGDPDLKAHKPGIIYLARVPKDRLFDQSAYEWFAGLHDGRPTWSANRADQQPVFQDANGVGWCASVSYNAGLKRYLLCTEHSETHQGCLGIFDVPEPWGPWTTVSYDSNWLGTDTTFFWNFSNKWLSADGRDFTLLFTGIKYRDAWNTVRGRFTVATAQDAIDNPHRSDADLEFIDTSFENASPLYWEVDDEGAVHIYPVYDRERASPNRANGHWHFQLQAKPGAKLTLVIHNLDNVWNGKKGSPVSNRTISFVSADGREWQPLRAELLPGNRLQLKVTMPGPRLYVARLEPYRLSDLAKFLESIRSDSRVEIARIGKTVEGRDLEIIRVGKPDAPNRVFLRARAHPWEPGGNWVVEGLIRRLLKDDEAARRYLARYCVYVLPMANKDGVARGRTRFNLQGKDLNRDWDKPADPKLAPENRAVEAWIEAMIKKDKKPNLALDFHNDEGGRLHISRPSGTDLTRYLQRMKTLEDLLRKHTWFTEGSTGGAFRNTGTIGEGLLARYGIDAAVHELNANWIAGLKAYPSAKNWELYGEQLCQVFFEYFAPPTFTWEKVTPESQGMSKAKLDALKDGIAAKSKALLVVRNDKIVYEWYADDYGPTKIHYSASLAKATVAGLSLAVALTDGRIALDDKAAKYIPQWKDDPEKAKIEIRHLGSHTSGLADAEEKDVPHAKLSGWRGDFWKLLPSPRDPFTLARDQAPVIFEPGAKLRYSNPAIGMLTYTVTSTLKDAPQKDIRTLLRERVMRPIGVPDKEWSVGYGKTPVVDGLPLVPSWGGGGYTARALARIGRLLLHKGDWDGTRLLSKRAVREVTNSAGLPGDCGMGWWTNAALRYPKLPKDAVWGAGAGDQILLVIPSLNLILVRNGGTLVPPPKSAAADDVFALYHDERTKVLFDPLIEAVTAPYPPSPVIKGITWAPKDTIIRKAKDSDIWATTWADDGDLYTAYGDGTGFTPKIRQKLSLGLARIEGDPERFTGVNIRSSSIEQTGDGPKGQKPSGLLMVDGVLYLWVRNAGNARLAWSADRGRTWTWADWKLTAGFGCPTFLNFGPNYAGARDGFVYVYSHDSGSAYKTADRIALARVPRDRIRNRDAYEFFTGTGSGGEPLWSKNIAQRGSVFTNPGKCYRVTASYNAGLKRYLLCQAGMDKGVDAGFGIFDAPEPWGPWTTVTYTPSWDVNPGETCSLPAKWISTDGKTLHLICSGGDCLCVRKATLTTRGGK